MRRQFCAIALLALVAAGCGDDDDDTDEGLQTTEPTEETVVEETITVLAAASLTDAFTELAAAFEEANPGATVELSFGPSSGLATQITEGAPADVFASADQNNMQKVADEDAVAGDPEVFVRNLLEIAVPPDNPGAVDGLDDFANADLLIGLCAEEVPCGRFARELLDQAGIVPSIDSNEPDVRSLLTRVEAGELDAGLVYRTDVQSSDGGVTGIEIPEDENVVAEYPIAVLAEPEAPDTAQNYVDFVLSEEGQSILEEYGFLVG